MTYPDDPVAQVLALVDGEGYSIQGAAREVGVNERTAWDWVQRAKEITQGNKPILDRWHRRVGRSLDLMERGLDVIDQDESNQTAYKSLQTLNIIAGTGTDKLLRASQDQQPQHLSQVLIVLNAGPQLSADEGESKDA